MSGYADLTKIKLDEVKIEEIPCVDATAETLRGLGELVSFDNFESTKIIFTSTLKDSRTNKPVIIPENETSGKFHVWTSYGIVHAENTAVDSGLYSVAIQHPKNKYRFIIREINYHPEGSQLVMSLDGDPFILILGNTLENIKAYSFDGSQGFHIYPGIWHQPPIIHYPERITFLDKQAATHLCVLHDFFTEENKVLSFSYA